MSAKLINVTLDLETLGTDEDAAIIQIGCCIPEFDRIYLPAGISPEFEVTISYDAALTEIRAGVFTQSAETVLWWEKQPIATRKHVFSGQSDYGDAFDQFKFWLDSVRSGGAEVAIWGNGSDFDNRLLSYSLDAFGYHRVWDFRNNRDLRTLKALFPILPLEEVPDEIKHTALGDAKYEARFINTVWDSYANVREAL